MKNPNGFGTAYKLPGRRRNSWVARITTGWKVVTRKRGKNKGKEMPQQTYQIIGYFETKIKALDALTLHRLGASPVSPKQDVILKEVYEEWSGAKYSNIARSTENTYRAAWNYLQHLEKIKFKDLRTSHWEAAVNACKDKNLSKSTVRNIRSLAVALNKYALKNDIVDKNYASLVEMPKFEKTKKDRFSDPEIKKIKEAARKDIPWADTILMLIYTGFRIGEFLALTSFSVDLKKKIIIGGFKTEAGTDRTVPIHPEILGYVKTHLAKKGEALICHKEGKKISTKYYRENYYYPTLEKVGVRKLVPHSCRHTFCSMLADRGVETLYIKELAGHSQYAFTADRYTHTQTQKLKQAISKL